ncbi:hypothetical protein LguiA_014962 [Lonicera macranthoides]
MGFGGIIRDSSGNFVAAIQGSFAGRFSPLLAEAVGLREVLSWIKDRNEGPIVVESDSKFVVDALHHTKDDSSSLGIVLDDCKALLRDLDLCNVSFIYRSANSVAHSLAKAASSMPDHKVWEVMCPSFISDVLVSDLN